MRNDTTTTTHVDLLRRRRDIERALCCSPRNSDERDLLWSDLDEVDGDLARLDKAVTQ